MSEFIELLTRFQTWCENRPRNPAGRGETRRCLLDVGVDAGNHGDRRSLLLLVIDRDAPVRLPFAGCGAFVLFAPRTKKIVSSVSALGGCMLFTLLFFFFFFSTSTCKKKRMRRVFNKQNVFQTAVGVIQTTLPTCRATRRVPLPRRR